MMDLLGLGLALSVGQVGTGAQAVPPAPLFPNPIVVPYNSQPLPAPTVQTLPQMIVPAPTPNVFPRTYSYPVLGQPAPEQIPAPKNGEKKNGEEKKDGEEKKEEEKKEEEKKEPEKYWFMETLEGTALGDALKERRITITGWLEGSYTKGRANPLGNNGTVTWNDRNDRFLLQQDWVRIEKAVDTDSKCPSWGWHIDFLFGSDYRFTLPRGLWNSQLLNSRFTDDGVPMQNLYGVDLPQFYLSYYMPNLWEGTEVRFGRMFTPFGYESVEGVSTPLLSRSYAFNWAPPFTNEGLMILPTFSKQWSGKFMVANGNDVLLGDPAEEWRFVGAVTWTSEDSNDSWTFGTSYGRGKFNAGEPFNPATASTMSEAAGRNNINVFDLVYTHKICDRYSYAIEGIYGYQYGVPTTLAVGPISGAAISTDRLSETATWGSICQYFTINHTDKVSSILRAEVFDDFDGQRTGFDGAYYAVTYGIQWKPSKCWLIRPEVRYDYNGTSRPFVAGTQHGLFTAAADAILRW